MASAFGTINNPFGIVSNSTALQLSNNGEGLIVLANVLIKATIVMAGLYAFINIIVAGYGFLSSTEPKEVAKAWTKIWQSMLGLAFIAGSFILAAIFGWIIFKDPTALLAPKIYAP